mmetsp:Transcript_13035/g.30732  ORF Transcript_13035/g.30732 Transcript_13035/m.30732 type:complete len:653 (+) Transcript_13035:214-2172(+)
MIGFIGMLPFLLVAFAIRTAFCFVPFSFSRISGNPTIKRLSPVFATVYNSTLPTATVTPPKTNDNGKILKRAYAIGKTKDKKSSVLGNKTNKYNRSPPPSTIKKLRPSSQSHKRKGIGSIKINKGKGKRHKRKLRPEAEQFQWLHWVYNQWKDTSPGDLTDENVIKQMMAAVPRWSKRKSFQSAQRSEVLLGRLIQEAIAGNPHMRRNATTTSEKNSTAPTAMLTVNLFNAAMDGYGKIGDPAGVQRILRRMESLRTSGVADFADLKPDEFSMSTLATAWAKSHSEEAARKAEAIVQYMDLKGLAPNTITYNAVLHAIAMGSECDRALKAEDMVERMKRRHEENGEDCQPDVYTYQTLIQAWSKTTMPGSPQKAERILRSMDNEASSGKKNSHQLAPNTYCFTTVIHSWARSSEKNRARHAYQLLNVLTRRFDDAMSEYNINNTRKNKNRSKLLKPNVKTFTSVLNSCARPVDESEKEDAFAIAQLAMAELSLGTYGKPNFLSYAAYLAVCATTLEVGPKRDAETKKTFTDCIKEGQVGHIVLEKLHTAASPELINELIGEHIDERGQITIPPHWNKSIEGERVGGKSMAQTEVNKEIVRKIPKPFQQRLEDVQKFGGRSSIYSETHQTIDGENEGDGIEWSTDEFNWGARN